MRRKKRQTAKQPVSSGNKSDENTSKTDEVLINLNSGTENSASDEDTTVKKGKTAQRPPPEQSYKRPRVVKENDMDEDFASSSVLSSPLSSASLESSTRKSLNATDQPQLQQKANLDYQDDQHILDQENHQCAPVTQIGNSLSSVSDRKSVV